MTAGRPVSIVYPEVLGHPAGTQTVTVSSAPQAQPEPIVDQCQNLFRHPEKGWSHAISCPNPAAVTTRRGGRYCQPCTDKAEGRAAARDAVVRASWSPEVAAEMAALDEYNGRSPAPPPPRRAETCRSRSTTVRAGHS